MFPHQYRHFWVAISISGMCMPHLSETLNFLIVKNSDLRLWLHLEVLPYQLLHIPYFHWIYLDWFHSNKYATTVTVFVTGSVKTWLVYMFELLPSITFNLIKLSNWNFIKAYILVSKSYNETYLKFGFIVRVALAYNLVIHNLLSKKSIRQ